MLINISEATLRMESSWAVVRKESNSAAAAVSWWAATRARARSMRACIAAPASGLETSASVVWANTGRDPKVAKTTRIVGKRALLERGYRRKSIANFTNDAPKNKRRA